ncbi:MAG: site-specific DNA-methyltransferase [Candidatus Azambacteria bacterium]|nr:site-specific DNA-methyltransferase [Candidatus Azambacteria bacterium]
MTKEQKFYNILQDLFVGAKLEGDSGFVNLMNIKTDYFNKIKERIKNEVKAKFDSDQPEDLFDKLYTFFDSYFSDGGAIFFSSTPVYKNIYAKVYSDREDTALFWKTAKLYYVKSEANYKSIKDLSINSDPEIAFDFDFDASLLKHKQANEKKELEFYFIVTQKRGGKKIIKFRVLYKNDNKYTKLQEILKTKDKGKIIKYLLEYLKLKNIALNSEEIEKAFKIYKKQTEIDYFIHKDAKGFLREQFDLYLYQHLAGSMETIFSQDSLARIKKIKDIAYLTIDFIGNFEDELKKIWLKPKFARNSNYVLTLDRIAVKTGGAEVIAKILKHKGLNDQIAEWQELGIVENNFNQKEIIKVGKLNKAYQFLPVDTKYFKDLEIEIIGLFDNLDEELDGRLIKSDNFQALNTLLPKYKEQVQTIYVDPPFNTGDDFSYIDRYKDSSWLTLMDNRLEIARSYLSNDSGNIFLHLDMHADHYGRYLLESYFGAEGLQNEIIWHYKSFHGQVENYFPRKHDTIYYFRINPKSYFDLKRNEDVAIEEMSDFKNWGKYIVNGNEIHGDNMPTDVRFKRNLDKWIKENGRKPIEDDVVYVFQSQSYDDVWDISYLDPKDKTERIGYDTQKPEPLIKRIIESVSRPNDLICDFFAGSGTTISVSHKMGMRWLGIEVSEGFYEKYEAVKTFKIKRRSDFEILEVIKQTQTDITARVRLTGLLGRMKLVLGGYRCGISDKVIFNGGGFFKYYELEQYEDALKKSVYNPTKDELENIDFSLSEKQAKEGLEIDLKKETARFVFEKLYPDVDIAETISNLYGEKIIKITKDKIILEKREIDLNDLDFKKYEPLKKLIYW